jgi:hypothetical protein
MKRTVSIRLKTNDGKALKQILSDLPKELKIYEYRVDERTFGDVKEYTCRWYFNEPDWDLLRSLKQFLIKEGWKINEHCIPSNFSEEEKHSGQLFDFSTHHYRIPQSWGPSGRIEQEPLPIIGYECPCCGRFQTYLLKNPRLDVLIPEGEELYPTLFYTESLLWLMDKRLLEALQEQGLTTGLRWYPVTVFNKLDRPDYVGVYSDVNIGWPVAPYGSHSSGNKPCPVCGSVYPKYNFHNVFHRPETPSHWMWSPHHGRTHFFISRQVADWLWSQWLKGQTDRPNYPPSVAETGPWLRERHEWVKQREKLLLIMPPDPHGRLKEWDIEDFSLTRYGWYPDEAEQAFLPPQYQLELEPPSELEEFSPKGKQLPLAKPTELQQTIETCPIAEKLFLHHYSVHLEEAQGVSLSYVKQDGIVIGCRLRFQLDWNHYDYLIENQGFNFSQELASPIRDLASPIWEGEFFVEENVEFECWMPTDLLPYWLEAAPTVEQGVAYLLELNQKQFKSEQRSRPHPFLYGQYWLLARVKQEFELQPGQQFESVGGSYDTFWRFLSPSQIKISESEYGEKLVPLYQQWIAADQGKIKQINESLFKTVTDFFEEVSIDIEEAIEKLEALKNPLVKSFDS